MALGSALVLLLAASANEAKAARVRAARVGAHGLRAGQHGELSHAAPLNPTQAAAAVVGFFQAGGAGGGNATAEFACRDLLATRVDRLDEAWSDVHVKAALSTACSERGLFSAAAGNSSAEHLDCLSFAGRLAGARRARIANGTMAGYAGFCEEYAALALRQAPAHGKMHDTPASASSEVDVTREEELAGNGLVIILQIVFGIVYFFTVVRNYPTVEAVANPEDIPAKVKDLQDTNEVAALQKVSPSNCLLSWCCPYARAAHTFHATETLNYWCAFALMACFPFWGLCCSLFIANSCTPMNKKLGGEERNCLASLACSWFCSCCVIAQDAESMDLLVGVKTGVCSVAKADD